VSEPCYDLAWEQDNQLIVVEVKSLTVDEVRQLRAGLGQVLDYAYLLGGQHEHVIPVHYVGHRPADDHWMALCRLFAVARDVRG
jgi:hypothetical protein